MGGFAVHFAAKRVNAFVRHHHFHRSRLADDAMLGRKTALLQFGNHHRRAEAADFFVVRQGDVQRPLQARGFHLRHGSQYRGDKTFHIGRTAPV